MTKKSFPMSNHNGEMFAVLLDLGALEQQPLELGTMGDITITHQYQCVAVFVNSDAAYEWKGYQKCGDRMTVCSAKGFKTDIDLTNVFGNETE